MTTFDDNPLRHSPATVTPPPPPPEEKPYVTSTTTTTTSTSEQQQHYSSSSSSSSRHSSTSAVVTTTLNFSTGVANVLPSHDNSTTESSSAVLLLDSFGFNHSGTDVPLRPTTTTTTLSIASILLPGENVTVIEVRKTKQQINHYLNSLSALLTVFSDYERTL